MGFGLKGLVLMQGFGNNEGFSVSRYLHFLEDFENPDWIFTWNGTNRILLEDFENSDWIFVWNGTHRILLEDFENGGW